MKNHIAANHKLFGVEIINFVTLHPNRIAYKCTKVGSGTELVSSKGQGGNIA